MSIGKRGEWGQKINQMIDSGHNISVKNGFAGWWRLSFVAGKGKLFPWLRREQHWTTQEDGEDCFKNLSKLLKEVGTIVHPNEWEMIGGVVAGQEGPLLVLNETKLWASGRSKWNRLQEQCSQQNSELVLLGKSEFVNPKRKRFYSKIGEDKSLMGYFYHKPFPRCYEEGIGKLETEHEKWNEPGGDASDAHVSDHQDGDAVYRDWQSMQEREA